MYPDIRATKYKTTWKKGLPFSYYECIQALFSKFGICRVNIIAARGEPTRNATPVLFRASLRYPLGGLKKEYFLPQ